MRKRRRRRRRRRRKTRRSQNIDHVKAPLLKNCQPIKILNT
jgi:hypothetical protein